MKFFYFIASMLLFTACNTSDSLPSKQFWMDNPTEKAIQVKIDSTVYDLPPNSGMTVDLSAGQHSLAYNGESLKFFVKPNDQGSVINPTLSNYIFFNEIYVVEGREDKAEAEYEKIKNAYFHPFVLETGDTISVPFKVIENQLFIEQYEYYWHFGITEPYKNVRLNMGNTSLATVNRSKLFRENDFFQYIGTENLPKGFKLPQNQYNLKDQKEFVLIPDTLNMDCEVAQKYLDRYRDQYKNLLKSDAANYHAAYDSVKSGYYHLFPTEIERECSPRYNKEKSSSDDNFDIVNVTIGKNLEKFLEKNAIIIKD